MTAGDVGPTTPALGPPGGEPADLPWIWRARTELNASILSGALLLLGVIGDKLWRVPGVTALYWISLAIGLFYGGRAALQALRHRKFDIDVLMAVAAILAAYVGHPEEGALLLFLFVLSGALEDLALERTRREVEALHTLMPAEALVLRDGQWLALDPSELVVDDVVRVRPGERVPADAVVTNGRTAMDQAAITGESVPRSVGEGDELYAGTINVDDPIEARVIREASQSSLQKVLDLVIRAREQREPAQRVIDRLSEPYAVGVLALSLATLLLFRLALGHGWMDALNTAITLLVVASPCALVIATPTATLSAISRGARAGVLFKGGQSIERLSRVGAVCFDKTGTLTIGRPRLYEVHPVAWSDGTLLLAAAAALERDSTHPIAVAIREAGEARGVPPVEARDVDHTAGRGMRGTVAGHAVRLGSYRFAEEVIPACLRNRVKDVLERIQQRGHIGVVVALAGEEGAEDASAGQAAVLIMADAVRPGAHDLVDDLHALGVRPVRMLTGDNKVTASRVAESLRLDRFDAELMPEDKLRAVADMKRELATDASRRYRGVAVIGDGVNDAPALAAADVSVAIGAIGTAAALESADIVLLADDLRHVPWAVRLARSARRTIAANLVLALVIIVAMGIVTIVGSLVGRPLPLWIGVLAHEGGTILVVFHSLLLLRFPALRARPHAEPAGARSAPLATPV